MTDAPKTIFKLRTTRRTKAHLQFVLILFGLVALFVIFAAVQVGVCKWHAPDLTAAACLLPESYLRSFRQ